LQLLLLLFLEWGIYYFIRTKKSKDKIIHQLLSGETKDKISSSTNEVGVKEKEKELEGEPKIRKMLNDIRVGFLSASSSIKEEIKRHYLLLFLFWLLFL